MTPESFWARVDKSGQCWEWRGSSRINGYGSVRVKGSPLEGMGIQSTTAHRYAYSLMVGPIPVGYQVDHLCKNTRCVNPDHLEAVTPRENTMRSTAVSAVNASKTECIKGHPLRGSNLRVRPNGDRQCHECRLERQRESRRAAALTNPGPGSGCHQAARTHCPQGHPYDEANTYMTKDGKRMCRECMRSRTRARSAREKARKS